MLYSKSGHCQGLFLLREISSLVHCTFPSWLYTDYIRHEQINMNILKWYKLTFATGSNVVSLFVYFISFLFYRNWLGGLVVSVLNTCNVTSLYMLQQDDHVQYCLCVFVLFCSVFICCCFLLFLLFVCLLGSIQFHWYHDSKSSWPCFKMSWPAVARGPYTAESRSLKTYFVCTYF